MELPNIDFQTVSVDDVVNRSGLSAVDLLARNHAPEVLMCSCHHGHRALSLIHCCRLFVQSVVCAACPKDEGQQKSVRCPVVLHIANPVWCLTFCLLKASCSSLLGHGCVYSGVLCCVYSGLCGSHKQVVHPMGNCIWHLHLAIYFDTLYVAPVPTCACMLNL